LLCRFVSRPFCFTAVANVTLFVIRIVRIKRLGGLFDVFFVLVPAAIVPFFLRYPGNTHFMSRAEFECFCGRIFETWAERTSTFTVECRTCGRLLRPQRFIQDEAATEEDDDFDTRDDNEDDYEDEDDYNAIDDEDTEAEESDEADLPRYGVARFNCDCGHTFTSYAERAPHFYCPCYRCGSHMQPAKFLSKDKVRKKRNSTETHSCSVCNGSGNCPVVGASGGGGASRR
jgi:hypothetical protein